MTTPEIIETTPANISEPGICGYKNPATIEMAVLNRLFIFVLSAWIIGINAQTPDLYMPRNIQQAYEKETRSADGNPGNNYWQNQADYKINVKFNPANQRLSGTETIHYSNHSPDTLKRILLHLFPNILKEENYRDYPADINDLIDGVEIEKISIDGSVIDTSADTANLVYTETNCWVNLPDALPPAEEITLDISWNFRVNKKSHYREGGVDSSSFFIAYFFPRVAVYDDIDGWNEFLYLGLSEFYNDFGDFDVSITVPKNFMIWATGEWQNPQDILQRRYYNRYLKAKASDTIVSIIDSTESDKANITIQNPENTFHFTAYDVPDFAFGVSDHYLWDASSLAVDSKTDRRIFIDVAYDKNTNDFYQVADIARRAISFMSEKMPGMPFPYLKLTVFNGLANMEYPMMVNDQDYNDIKRTTRLAIHEILHTYLPFYCGINESKYGWMDEGWATFGHFWITSDFIGKEHAEFYFMPGYQEHKGHAMELPLFALSDYLKRPLYHDNTYVKAAAFYLVLKNYLGEEQFIYGMQQFMQRWRSKHPTPYDFFNTFNDVTDKNINWLVKTWFFEFGYVDLAIGQAVMENDSLKITILNKGKYPAPVSVKINDIEGSESIIDKGVAIWEKGNSKARISIKPEREIKSIELLDESRIDADLSNNYLEF